MPTPAENSGPWVERLKVHSYDVDFNHRASLESVCRLFLEAAWNHAENLGVGFHHLSAKKKFWVLSRMAMEIDEYPRWGEEVTLVTWPRGATSIFAMRDFEIFASSNRRLVGGSTAWLVLDARTKRPQRMEQIAASIRGLQRKAALERDPEKLAAVENGNLTMATTAHYSAIDVNRHVNSARYIGWILDSYPLDFHRLHLVRRLQVNYLGETLSGEEISVLTAAGTTGVFYHSILKAGCREVCRAQVLWGAPAPVSVT
jgi:acyl-ACP thioesterase